MRVDHDRLVICGVWSARPTRLNKGDILRTAATGFPEFLDQTGAILSADCERNPAAEALEQEQLKAWVAVPLPSARFVEGGLGLCASKDVFNGHREFFSLLGVEIGERMAELARASEPYRYERESLLVLNREPLPDHVLLFPERFAP
jgi:hypothetical protein